MSKLNPENSQYKDKYEIYSSIPAIDIGQVAKNLNDNKTRVQRDAYWDKIKDTRIAVEGKVEDVRPGGWLSYGSVEINASGVEVKCDLTEEAAQRTVDIAKGQTVRCEGTASVYTILFGELSLVVSDGLIVKR